MILPPVDRLRVFVSSTINECAQERKVVEEAIHSINHDPVLFEKVGARPYPPREVYKPRLESSHILVAVYRSEYGSIVPGMEISGIEDESRIASDSGIERLVYVLSTPGSRDPRLQALIELAKNSMITIAHYADPEDLREMIRNDVTALVSERFVKQAMVVPGLGPSELLESVLPNRNHRLRRAGVEETVLNLHREVGRLLVTGPLGSGKTVLVAQLASDHKWAFVDGRNLDRLDLLAQSANALRDRMGQPAITYATEDSARQALHAAWGSVNNVTLAVDGAVDPALLWDLPSNSNHLVLTARVRWEVSTAHTYEIPALTSDEVESWVTALRGSRVDPGEAASLLERSHGNPLYLRFYALGQPREGDLSLRELEIRAFQALPPRARELVTYLTLAGVPLSLADLEQLLGRDFDGPEAVATLVEESNPLLRQSRGYVELVHEHTRQTLLEQLKASLTRIGFFASRLGGHLEASREYILAYHVYDVAGERRHADRLLDRATHQAALRGGGAPAIPIFRRKADRSRELSRVNDEVQALLGLAQVLQQTGARDDAQRALVDARSAAGRSTDARQLLLVRETELILDIHRSGSADRVPGLRTLRDAYQADGNPFDAARVSTLLSAEHIAGGDYGVAEQDARDALRYFESVGDDYGIRISRINLAAAISGIDGREEEASAIAHQLDEGVSPSDYPRERAVVCNILTRRYRELGETSLAASFATEAISIGERLGDRHVIAINRINLGNVHRDEGQLDIALSDYRAADRAAADGGFRRDEAAANELIASVLNEQKDHALAITHAQHAVATARLAGDHLVVARASEELATALIAGGNIEGAVDAYIEGAKSLQTSFPGGSLFVSLVGSGLSACASKGRVDLKTRLLASVFTPELEGPFNDSQRAVLRALYGAIPGIARGMSPERALPIIALAVADLLKGIPTLIARKIVLQCVNVLLGAESVPAGSLLTGVAAILLASPWETLSLSDLVEISDRVTEISPLVHFKPHPDGAAHWTVRLEIAGGVIATVTQMDDDPRTSATCMAIALLLAGLGHTIGRDILEAEQLPRHEIVISVVSRADFDANIDPSLSGIRDLPAGFVVTESTDVKRDDQPPIFVVCAPEFGEPWQPNRKRLSDVHRLLAELLRVLASHLLAQEVEPAVLFPKIGGLIRSMGYRGDMEREPGGEGVV